MSNGVHFDHDPGAEDGDEIIEPELKTTMQNYEIEGQKGLIDFSKVVLTFSSGVTIAYIGYYLTKGGTREPLDLIPLGVLLISAFLSFFGFGRAIGNLRNGSSDGKGILWCNLGAIALFVGLGLAFFINPGEDKFADSLNAIVSELKEADIEVSKKDLKSCEIDGEKMIATFVSDTNQTIVSFDTTKKSIATFEVKK